MNLRFPDYSLLQYTQPKQRFSFLALYEMPKGYDYEDIYPHLAQQFAPEGATMLPSFEGNYGKEGKIQATLAEFLTMSTQNLSDVNFSVNKQSDETLYNARLHWGGRRNFEDTITIQFREYVQSPIKRIFSNWQKLVNDPVTNNVGYASRYKGKIIKLELDPNFWHEGADGVDLGELLGKMKEHFVNLEKDESPQLITRQVIFEGVWPQTIPEMGGNYTDDSLETLTVTFSVDRYYEDHDWQRYFKNVNPIGTMLRDEILED